MDCLIAVVLEQTVEYIHERHELEDTREEIAHELVANDVLWAKNEENWRYTFAELTSDLIVLKLIQEHAGTAQNELPGVLRWEQSPFQWNHAVWDSAQIKGVVQRMRLAESNRHQEYYGRSSTDCRLQFIYCHIRITAFPGTGLASSAMRAPPEMPTAAAHGCSHDRRLNADLDKRGDSDDATRGFCVSQDCRIQHAQEPPRQASDAAGQAGSGKVVP